MIKFFTFFPIVFLLLQNPLFSAANSKLVDERLKELRELNSAVLKNTKILEKYDGQTVYIKAHLIERENNAYELILNTISSKKIPEEKTEIKSTIYLEGKVSKLPDREYKLDIIYVFPPENKDANTKEKE
jgi:hypothetical protein